MASADCLLEAFQSNIESAFNDTLVATDCKCSFVPEVKVSLEVVCEEVPFVPEHDDQTCWDAYVQDRLRHFAQF